MTQIKYVMKTQIITVDWNASVMVAKRLMIRNKINFLPVLDDRNKFYGVITSWDLLKENNPKRKLRRISVSVPWCIAEDESCFRAAIIMISHKIHHLLVLDKRKLVGIVSSYDLLLAILK